MTGVRAVKRGAQVLASSPGLGAAGMGGVGGGTGLVALAQAIGPSTPLGAVLLYLSPAASFVIGSVLYYAQVQATRYMEGRLVKNAMKTLRAQLDNPLTSPEHKTKILKLLEEAERHIANAEVQRIKQLGQPQYQQE